MTVVYGKPLSYSLSFNSSLTWDQCVKFCWEQSNCVLAYNKGGDLCEWFPHGNLSTVQQKTNKEKFFVAFKINSTSNQCLTGVNPPTFGNKPATGSATVYEWQKWYAAIRYNYTITLAKGIWTFNVQAKTACPTTAFVHFLRDNGDQVCLVMPVYQPKIPYSEMPNGCINYDSIPTGATSEAEVEKFQFIMRAVRIYPPAKDYSIRVSGKRTDACKATPTTKQCQSSKGFTFIDPVAKDLSFYKWVTSPGAQAKPTDLCVVLIIIGNDPMVADVQSCDGDTPMGPYAVMCQRPAWVW